MTHLDRCVYYKCFLKPISNFICIQGQESQNSDSACFEWREYEGLIDFPIFMLKNSKPIERLQKEYIEPFLIWLHV